MLQIYSALCITFVCLRSGFAAPQKIDIASGILRKNETTHPETESIQPQFITIEHLESLLRRAGEIFRPLMMSETTAQQNVANIPLQQLQPPTVHPFNFYLPPFEHEEELDEKSRSMEKFTPPPPSNDKEETNYYYSSKPKKIPKKFNAAEKLVNIKWLNAFEREALSDGNGQIPKAVYLVNDERNRINFDDSFFAVDMHIPIPEDNNPHKEIKSTANNEGEQEFLNQAEDGEDLVAAPAANIPRISYKINSHSKTL